MIVLRNQSEISKVNSMYISIMNKAVEAFKEVYGNDILEIRLQGSVSRGEEIKNVSDLDMLCILKEDTDLSVDKRIADVKTVLSERLLDLTGIDLDVTNEVFLREHYDYWLIVCTDSLCLYGPNTYFKSEVYINGTELAKLWNPNTQRLIHFYRDRLSGTDNPDEIKKICKLVGKDILKSYRPELMEKYDLFHKSIPQTCTDLCDKNKDKRVQYQLLLDLYLNHTADKARILKVLDLVENQQ